MARSRRAPLARSASLPLSNMSARKSASVSAGGVNVRRLMLLREAAAEHKSDNEDDDEDELEDKAPNNECGNPFCRQVLSNRYARFCEDKPMCQRYRALKLQCLANAQADSDQEDTQPLSYFLKKKKKKNEKKGEEFAIPRKNKAEGKKTLDLSVEGTGQKDTLKKKRETQLEEKKKILKRAREGAESSGKEAAAAVPFSRSPSITSSVSSVEEVAPLTKRLKNKVYLRPETVETGKETNIPRVKKRRLSRHTSADHVLSRSAPSSPVRAAGTPAAPVSETNWKIPRAKPIRPRTTLQAMRNMNVDLVPLGVATPASLAGGGRYVQNGNRSAVQSLRASDPRARPPKMTKFTPPAVPAPAAAVLSSAPSRPVPQPTVPAPQPTVQAPAPPEQAQFPPLPPQAPFLPQPVPRSSRSNTPLSSPVENSAVVSSGNTSSGSVTHSNGPVARPPEVHRISTADYRKNRKSDAEWRQQGELPSRSSSLERSTSFPGNRAPGFPPPASAYPPAPPRLRRNDSAPLSTYREPRLAVDPRRQYPGDMRPYYDSDGNRMEYRDRPEGRGDGHVPAQRGARNFPPPHDLYPPRQQEMSSFGMHDAGYDYQEDTRAPPPVEQSYWREPSCGEPPAPPPPKRATSPRRGEVERVNDDRKKSDHDDLEDPPLFSYHDEFLPGLLYVFIHKFPGSLEAVLNVTKKPRKMNWYIKYAERIERFCGAFDLQIKFEGLAVKVTVRGREWLTLHATSTITLYLDVIKSLRAEAITWKVFYEEMEKARGHYTSMYGSQVNESYCFLRAWNDLKKPGNYISLARQANYLCGARLHHWNFVIGKVEIGSGSHEDKREAFRLATVSALDFLLSIGSGRRIIRKREPPERASEPDTRRRRSSSRESTANDRERTPPVTSQENATEPSSATAVASEQPSEQPSAGESAACAEQSASTPQPKSSTEPLSSAATQTNLDEPATSRPNNQEVESDPGEEMSVSDTSDVTPAASPRTQSDPSSGVPLTVPESGKTTASAAPGLAATPTSEAAEKQCAAPADSNSPATESMGTTPAGKSATADGDGDSTSYKDTAVSSTPLRRCMMCEMIRMRKPDGERCLRCQQKANEVLN
ncbi:hypothetical protein V7S43_003131 [Phytophthora oleae]|uniref:Uncharacterized protein n=1 Tax=Phytophthora oleae TaxID=2107226 RepID=A0ABD3FZW6_9STRA